MHRGIRFFLRCFGPQAVTAYEHFDPGEGRERVRKSGLGKPQLLTGEAGVLPLACPAVDGDGKKAKVDQRGKAQLWHAFRFCYTTCTVATVVVCASLAHIKP